jgi:hypothetical protein
MAVNFRNEEYRRSPKISRTHSISLRRALPTVMVHTRFSLLPTLRIPQRNSLDEAKFATSSPLSIGEGQYFLLGDNRDNSVDSRYRGTVPRELIWGAASVIYWSSFEDKATHEERVRSERSSRRSSNQVFLLFIRFPEC